MSTELIWTDFIGIENKEEEKENGLQKIAEEIEGVRGVFSASGQVQIIPALGRISKMAQIRHMPPEMPSANKSVCIP